ncbi:HlyD family efflux transporter periplasmic adaptor subunit [candidate division KSB1 bacterium]|nr:MAG: HlyD family efflux transporter periplasmic adaptor subunit [candidate division KSB1 bacterium]
MDRVIEKKTWAPKRIALFAIPSFFVLLVLYSLIFGNHDTKLNVQKERIIVSAVERSEFQEFIPVTGTVIPIQTVYIDALEGGRVEEIFVEAGNLVNANDTILRLENTNLLLDISRQQAAMLDQKNSLRNTQLQMEKQKLELYNKLADLDYQINRTRRIYEQNETLLENKIISRQEYEESKDDYEYNLRKRELAILTAKQDSIMMAIQVDQLAQSLKRVEENLRIAKKRLENLTIIAPVGGQLTSLNAEYVGEITSAGERIGQIDILDGFKIRAGIDEHYLARIVTDLKGEFDFGGETFRLAIVKIFPEIVNGRFNVDLEFVDAMPTDIRRGQTVHIRLELGDLSEAITLARGGFYQKTGGQWAFVVDPSGEFATKREIRLGRKNTDVFEVLAGLEPGEHVVTSSYDTFGDAERLILK